MSCAQRLLASPKVNGSTGRLIVQTKERAFVLSILTRNKLSFHSVVTSECSISKPNRRPRSAVTVASEPSDYLRATRLVAESNARPRVRPSRFCLIRRKAVPHPASSSSREAIANLPPRVGSRVPACNAARRSTVAWLNKSKTSAKAANSSSSMALSS